MPFDMIVAGVAVVALAVAIIALALWVWRAPEAPAPNVSTEQEQRIERYQLLIRTRQQLRKDLGREPSTREIWEAINN